MLQEAKQTIGHKTGKIGLLELFVRFDNGDNFALHCRC